MPAPTAANRCPCAFELADRETDAGDDAPDERVLQRERRPEHNRRKRRHHGPRGDRPWDAERADTDRRRERRRTRARDRHEELPGEHRRSRDPEHRRERPEERRCVVEERVLVRGPLCRRTADPLVGEREEEAVVRKHRAVMHDEDADGDDDANHQSEQEHRQDRMRQRPAPEAARRGLHKRSYAGCPRASMAPTASNTGAASDNPSSAFHSGCATSTTTRSKPLAIVGLAATALRR